MKTLLILGLSGLITATTYAQPDRRGRLDSLYNDPFFYPTVSAVLLPKGFVEVNAVGALLTTNRIFNEAGRMEPLNARTNSLSTLLQVTYGLSETSRVNVGLDLFHTAYRLDPDPNASPWRIGSADSVIIHDAGLSTVGLRVRWKPLPRNRRFVLQGFLYQPTRRLFGSQPSVRVQAVYVFELSRKLYLFAQGGLTYYLPKRPLNVAVSVPLLAILQYQLRPTLGLLGLAGHTLTATLPDRNERRQTSFATQLGGGVQFQPSLRFGVTGLYTRNVLGRNTAPVATLNLGVRLIF